METENERFEYYFELNSAEQKVSFENYLTQLLDDFHSQSDKTVNYEINDVSRPKRLTGKEILIQAVLLMAAPVAADLYEVFRDRVIKPLMQRYKVCEGEKK